MLWEEGKLNSNISLHFLASRPPNLPWASGDLASQYNDFLLTEEVEHNWSSWWFWWQEDCDNNKDHYYDYYIRWHQAQSMKRRTWWTKRLADDRIQSFQADSSQVEFIINSSWRILVIIMLLIITNMIIIMNNNNQLWTPCRLPTCQTAAISNSSGKHSSARPSASTQVPDQHHHPDNHDSNVILPRLLLLQDLQFSNRHAKSSTYSTVIKQNILFQFFLLFTSLPLLSRPIRRRNAMTTDVV